MAEVTLHLTPYQFGANSPVMYNDPTGLFMNNSPEDFSDFWDNLLRQAALSDYGGTWTSEKGFVAFHDEDDAFLAGGAYNDKFGLWGKYEYAKSFEQAVTDYYSKKWAGTGRYNIKASYAIKGRYAGKGFLVHWNADAPGEKPSGNTLNDVLVGSMFVSTVKMKDHLAAAEAMSGWDKAMLGVGAFGVGATTTDELINYGVGTSYKSARTYTEFNKLSASKQVWRIKDTYGKQGLTLSKGLAWTGRILGGVAVLDAFMKVLDDPSLGNLLRLGVNVGLMGAKLNPMVNITMAILDATGVTDKIYDGINNLVK